MLDLSEPMISSVITGIIASIVFYFILYLIKPRIKLSDVMCIDSESDKYKIMKIKVVNLSRSMLMNINYTLHYCVDYEDGLTDVTEIPPRKPPLSTFAKYTRKNTDYAIRITYKIPNDSFPLRDNVKLVFTIQTTHPISNTSKCIAKNYRKNDIKQGTFESGRSTKFILRREA